MPKELTWPKAINKVLSSSSKPLDYNEITERIIAEKLRKNIGATPSHSRKRKITMKRKITIAMLVFVLFSFSTFQTEAGQKSGLKHLKNINQPTFQIKQHLQTSQNNNKQAGQFNSNAVILSREYLINWNQIRTNFIRLTGQVKVSPQKRMIINKVERKLNKIYGKMQRVAELQKNPLENKSALMKVSYELQKYEKQIKRLQQELGSPLQSWDEKRVSAGDDAQLANIDLQKILQEQQQTIQIMTNVAKVLHETAKSIIRHQ